MAEPRVSAWETKDSKPLDLKICRSCGNGRNSQDHGRVLGRGPQGPGTHTNPPLCESAF